MLGAMTHIGWRAAVITGFATLLVGFCSVEEAVACDNNKAVNDHCYARTVFSTTGGPFASEATGAIFLGCLGVEKESENIQTDEMWALMDDESWVEAGLITGDVEGPNHKAETATEPRFFVSYQREGMANEEGAFYNEDIGPEAPTSTLNEVFLRQTSPGKSKTWKGWTAGTGWVETASFKDAHAAVELQAGLETSENGGWNDAAVADLAYLSANGDEYTTDWSHGAYHAEAQIAGPEAEKQHMYFTWEHHYYEADFGFHNHGC
jgi:hypothetical protein